MGDSYNGSGGAGGDYNAGGLKEGQPRYPGRNVGNLKPKDLCGIPWMLAFALRADGWYLRSDIIWSKPNPMPESVRDRPTKSHEYLFLLSKSARYFYDQDAIREPIAESTAGDHRLGWYTAGRPKRDFPTERPDRGGGLLQPNPAGRNRRTVWNIATVPYSGAHFATFPPALVEPCIKAGTSECGCCPECGAPWERVMDYKANYTKREPARVPGNSNTKVDSSGWEPPLIENKGWQPICSCGHEETVPCIVLDPFVGSGTTVQVARQLGRQGIGLDLSMEYLGLARKRLELDKLEAWESGGIEAKTNLEDLPLFRERN
jgi:hypothetical protein